MLARPDVSVQILKGLAWKAPLPEKIHRCGLERKRLRRRGGAGGGVVGSS
jgi:hypothetical protein